MQYSAVVADPCTITRLGKAALLTEMGVRVVAGMGEGPDVLRVLSAREPDLLVTEIAFPGFETLEVLRRACEQDILGEEVSTKVLVLTTEARDAWISRAFQLGTSGYVLKSEPTGSVEVAVQAVLRGERYLSPKLAGR